MNLSSMEVWWGPSGSEPEAGSEPEEGSAILDGDVVCLTYVICFAVVVGVDILTTLMPRKGQSRRCLWI
jgi:hypothetical protein